MDAQSFLDEVRQDTEGFNQTLNTPAPSTGEKEEEKKEEANPPQQGEVPKQEEPNTGEQEVPFHKHPRFKEVYDDLKEERTARKELEERLKEFEGKLATKQEPQPVSVPEWWMGDEASWQQFAKRDQSLIAQAKQEAKQEFQREQLEAKERDEAEKTKANEMIEESLGELRTKYGQFDTNRLYKIIEEYRPTTEDGTWWDFERAYKILQMQEQAERVNTQKSVESKKKVASISSATDKPSGEKPKVTPGMDWRDFINLNS